MTTPRITTGGRPSVSVVIPTYNRRQRLAGVLDALERQSADPRSFEVIVVDDGSTDGTDRMLARRSPGFELSLLQQENRGPGPARNSGVARAQAPIVLFLDDDVEPLPALVAEHLASHAAHPDSAVIGPQLSLPAYSEPWTAWNQRQLENQYRAMERGDFAPSYRQFWTGNASLARELLLDSGGFDPSFPRAEDVELGYRLARRGILFCFNPRAGGLHHAQRSLAAWERAHRNYGALEVQIFGRSGERELLEILSGNWTRLHPATRRLVEVCVDDGLRLRGVCAMLRALLTAARVAPASKAAYGASSLLANLAYWSECSERLGKDWRRRLNAVSRV